MTEKLTTREQIVLMETINILPLTNIIRGTVEAHETANGKVAITFGGVAIIPKLQLESVRKVLEQERIERELEEGTE